MRELYAPAAKQRTFGGAAWIACTLSIAFSLSACNEKNTYVPPPPPKVDIALPLNQNVTRYLMATGSTAAINTTALVARVQGFVQSIDYKDGDTVKAGAVLFVIEPEPYQLALQQAQAAQSSAEASMKQLQADYQRQSELAAKGFTPQATLDQSTAQREAGIAKVKQSQADTAQAELNLSYTQVKAPFDGIVTARQVSLGQLVAAGSSTLATIVQLDPIYVNFTLSEEEVQRICVGIRKRGITQEELKQVKIEVGLQTETGFPHAGTLDYASPGVAAATGTLAVRAILPNADQQLLPGYFVRVRLPLFEQPDALLAPDRAIGSDQAGRYVLIVNNDNVVEQRKVELGQQVGALRVIEKGLSPTDRVVISGLMAAIPGQKVEPTMKPLTPPAAGASQ